MVSAEKKFKEYKKWCNSTITKPDFMDDDWKWAATWHILRTYFRFAIDPNVKDPKTCEIICGDVHIIKMEMEEGFPVEDLLIHSAVINAILESWLEMAIRLELYEVAQNLKNIFDFCEGTPEVVQ